MGCGAINSPLFSGMHSGWPSKGTVEPGGRGRVEQVDFIEQKEPTVFHGQGQRAVLEAHAALVHAVVPDQICEFHSTVSGDFKNRIVQPGRQLPDATRFSGSHGAEDIQRLSGIEKPDDQIAAVFMENIAGLQHRRKR
jgi:hypothetical protein